MTDDSVPAGSMSRRLFETLQPWRTASRWLVGYSGGLDSSVLLHALAQLARAHALPPLLAVHVDHRLQAASRQWALHCRRNCDALGVGFADVTVTIARKPRESLEDAARKARYAAFTAQMKPGDVLLLAHHADDQAETFLLRALRGAGVAGLAAMPMARALGPGTLVRPLLDIGRASLQQYADANGIAHVDDPSNTDQRFDRNFLRNAILPRLLTRWPGATGRLRAAARHLAEAHELLQEIAREDLARCDASELWGSPSLALQPLATLSPARRRNALRSWLAQVRGGPLLPSEMQLLQLESQWFDARRDASPCVVIRDVELRRYRGRGFCVAPQPAVTGGSWDLRTPYPVAGIGTLHAARRKGGMRPLARVDVRFRRGGETFRADNGHRQSLKEWMQAHGVPPWLRDRLPLLFDGDELVAIADMLIVAAYRCSDDEEGLSISLR